MRSLIAIILLLAGSTAPVAVHGAMDHGAHVPAPAFDEKHALTTSQGVLGKIPRDATLTRADGTKVRLADYRGRPLVVSLVYTSCYHICPTTTQHLAKIVRTAREALGTDSFRVVTIGFDTPKDTPAAMARFAREQRVDLPGWDFLGADAETIRQLTADLGSLLQRAAGVRPPDPGHGDRRRRQGLSPGVRDEFRHAAAG